MQRISILLFLLMPFLFGCAPSKLETQLINGTVSFDGKPISNAKITFFPKSEGGMIAAAASDEQGRFIVNSLYGEPGKGAVAGDYTVTVSWLEVHENEGTGEIRSRELLPLLYTNAETTPLEASIQKGKNTVTLELKSQ